MWNRLSDALERACSYYAQRIAFIDGERTLTYAEVSDLSNQVANGLLSLGVVKGEPVGMLLPNCLEYVPTEHGIWKSGATKVQLPARASADDHLHYLTMSRATTLVYHEQFDDIVDELRDRSPQLTRLIRLASRGPDERAGTLDYATVVSAQATTAPDAEVGPEDTAVILFTSGSTGLPKGVRYSHSGYSHFLIASGMEVGDIRAGEVFAHGAPLTHFTQIFVLPTLMRGGTNVLLPGLDVDLLFDAVERHHVTATAVVPTVIYTMLDHPRRRTADLSTLSTIVYAGSPMAPDRLKDALDAFGPVFVQTYAGTEPGFMTCLRKEDHLIDRLGSAGRPMFHVDVSVREADTALPIGEAGEICSRQVGRMLGYLDPSQDAEVIRGGWVHSGDVGYFDTEGYLYIVDRKKDMVVTGGYNVFPRQVEDVLLTHPGVAQCAVIGVPDPKWGEAVKAIVVVRAGATVSAAELMGLVKRRKGSVWSPKTVDFVASLPLNASGKVDKKSLKAPYWAGHSRAVN
jgi:acyl-CoA synthetase (AMP-forming)/AMP-acid ligase II